MAAIRRVRAILAVATIWILVSWWYTQGFSEFTSQAPSSNYPSDGSVTLEEAAIRWKKMPVKYPVESLAQLPVPNPAVKIPKIQAPRPEEDAAAKTKRLKRLSAVKESFQHSWEGYKKKAWLMDEVMPVTGDYKNPFGGWAATLVDALDTLWIMGMKSDFELAVKACDQIDFTTTPARHINVFETTIRYLGSFLAAYELSGKKYPSLLTKAQEVGELLLGAFDTPNRMPISRWDWRQYVKGQDQAAPTHTLLAEVGSLSLEFTKLSQLTGDLRFYDAVQRVADQLRLAQYNTSLPGLWPVAVDISKTPFHFSTDTYTLGGMSDSTYEYLPKQYLLLGGALEQPRKMYEGFIDVAKKALFRRARNPDNTPILFSGDIMFKTHLGEFTEIKNNRAQHLTCFVGGMVGISSKIFERPQDLEVASLLTEGCVWAYGVTATGIGPETFEFVSCDPQAHASDCNWSESRWYDEIKEFWRSSKDAVPKSELDKIINSRRLPIGMLDVSDRRYILRPEAIESVFIMYRLTGDAAWMDKAWKMFTAIKEHTRTSIAASALDDVTKEIPIQTDSMESFWLAETLKYFYLVFGEWDLIDLDEWVLDTEAHPLRRADVMGLDALGSTRP